MTTSLEIMIFINIACNCLLIYTIITIKSHVVLIIPFSWNNLLLGLMATAALKLQKDERRVIETPWFPLRRKADSELAASLDKAVYLNWKIVFRNHISIQHYQTSSFLPSVPTTMFTFLLTDSIYHYICRIKKISVSLLIVNNVFFFHIYITAFKN